MNSSESKATSRVGVTNHSSTNQSITIKSLVEAGAHFGHQTTKWNPKMLPYIYGARNGIHVINLDLTLKAWEKAKKFIYDIIASGGNLLYVATKQQSREIISQEAARSQSYCVTSRWLGGTLSNFETIKRSIERMRKLEDLLEKAEAANSEMNLHKKEKLMIRRQLEKLSANLGGIRAMKKPPEVLFVVDVAKEAIAVAEARRLHIPVVALVDTNCNPDQIAHAIPSNDDAARTIRLFAAAVADVVIEARAAYQARVPSEEAREKAVASNGKREIGGDGLISEKPSASDDLMSAAGDSVTAA
jgi:small subunit ribosomal protein S2